MLQTGKFRPASFQCRVGGELVAAETSMALSVEYLSEGIGRRLRERAKAAPESPAIRK